MKDLDRAAQQARGGVATEMWYFLRRSGKWWLAPIIAVFLLFGGLMLLSSTSAAPFIYSLF